MKAYEAICHMVMVCLFVLGATMSYYYITHSATTDTGDYHCRVRNLYGVVESHTARVYITIGTTSRFLISRNPPDDIKYPPSNLRLSVNTPSLIEGTQSTPASLDKTLKNVSTDPEKYFLDPPEKRMSSLPTKELSQMGW